MLKVGKCLELYLKLGKPLILLIHAQGREMPGIEYKNWENLEFVMQFNKTLSNLEFYMFKTFGRHFNRVEI